MEPNQITLRPFLEEDQTQILETVTSNQVNQTYMLPDFETLEAAIPLFNRLMNGSRDPNRFIRCISLDGKAIGFLNDVETVDNVMELGYVIHPDYHNRGFMTQALKLAIRELFDRKLAAVTCGAFEHNKASQRVMEKAGMHLIDKTEDIEYRGKTHLCVFYLITNEQEN